MQVGTLPAFISFLSNSYFSFFNFSLHLVSGGDKGDIGGEQQDLVDGLVEGLLSKEILYPSLLEIAQKVCGGKRKKEIQNRKR